MTSPTNPNLRRSLRIRQRTSRLNLFSVESENGDSVNSQEVNESDLDKALEYLLNKPQSQICRVSPLHGLEYKRFKQYALKIKEFLVNRVKTAQNLQYSAEICVINNLKLEVSHNDAIKIIVLGSYPDADSEKLDELLYHGVLFSWGTVPHGEVGVAHLPLLLDCGKAAVCVAVRRTLCKLFDCLVTPITLTQSHLVLFSAMLSSCTPEPEQEACEVKFEYKVPHTNPSTALDVCIEFENLNYFWKQCFDSKPDSYIYNEESGQLFYSVITSHILEYFGLDVASMELTRIEFPSMVLTSSGVVKMRELEPAKMVLQMFGQIGTLLMNSVPKLGAD